MEAVLGTLLGGSLLLVVLLYPLRLYQLYKYAKREQTNSRGIKNLKFQEWNHAWKRFVV